MIQKYLFKKSFYLSLLLLTSASIAQSNTSAGYHKVIDLGGTWPFMLDTSKIGIAEKWFQKSFNETIILPGTLDENKKGFLNKDTTESHLNRVYYYEGPAWFKKEIEIPDDWNGQKIHLLMERTKVTHVWIDSNYLGTNNTIFTPQVYELTGKVTAGKHALTIMVDNTASLVPVAGSHAYSEDTHTNWNGILGKFYLEASNPMQLSNIRVYPDIHSKQVKVKIKIAGSESGQNNVSIGFKTELWNSKKQQSIPDKNFHVEINGTETEAELIYYMGNDVQLWSEFESALYRLYVTLSSDGKILDNRQIDFGMREFRTKGTQFTINGLTTFLRGKHDAAVFPLTGYPPTDTENWIKLFRIAKSYGINHYRFHTWCPPEAAFEAADIVGIYLQPELPIWWGFNPEDSTHVPFIMKEGRKILNYYANHASFVMFALGNEISRDRNLLKKMVDEFREYDDRPLYAQGSNNRLWDPSYAEGDDYWTTFRTAKENADLTSDVRASLSFLDSKIGDGGILNTLYPSTSFTFSKAIENITVPVIGHETGQYSIYPDYNEMKKYTGVLKPWNFEIFRNRLKAKGMLDQADKFFKASGALSVICNKAEIEMAIRTHGFGGFQLLDLQDYPGQGTALVGILDAFMESKGLITPEEYRAFCNDVVLLLEMDKYCWQNNEIFQAEVKVANYSSSALSKKTINWKMVSDEKIIQSGEFDVQTIPNGTVTSIGRIELNLDEFQDAQRADLIISMEGDSIKNKYPVWIYPSQNKIQMSANIKIANELNTEVETTLNNGGVVLLFPDTSKIKNSVGGQFIPEFWNYGMFTSLAKQYGGRISEGTLGILTDPEHKIFKEFPTEFHSNWQWWSIIKNSRPIILDETKKVYRPIVQVIDNINRNQKLGLIFEFKVGKGKLLVCASNLPATDKPEAEQLYKSIIHYMGSKDFNPTDEITFEELKNILQD